GGDSLTALLAIGLVVLIGGLAAVAFVRVCGIALLGSPRSESADDAHESSPWMLGPMYVLIVLCLAAAVAPGAVMHLLAGTVEQIVGAELDAADAPLSIIGSINAWTMVAVL